MWVTCVIAQILAAVTSQAGGKDDRCALHGGAQMHKSETPNRPQAFCTG